jgi:16S rRNA (cytosine967-C5)-methyltransferase
MTLIAPARIAAFDLLCRIELQQVHSDDALNSEVVGALELRDRNLVTEIVYGTLRWRGWLDYILEDAVARAWETVNPKAKTLLRLSLYQMSHMDRVPDHAIIDDAVELAKLHLRPRAAGFVNGVLRNLGRQRPWHARDFHRDCPVWVRLSLPRWLWERWEARFGSDRACEFAQALNRQPQTAFRMPEQADLPAGARASDMVPGAYVFQEDVPRQEDPTLRFQDEVSQIIPYLLGPIEGACIWDSCAAPGGKSAILAERIGASGWLVASDLEPKRARRLSENLKSYSGAWADILVADASMPFPFRGAQFDAVVADVPCSGLGTLRRNPEIKWRFRQEWLAGLQRKQCRLLDAVSGAVRKGGRLLYSTCSTEPEENEQVIEGFLRSHPEFRLQPPADPPGVAVWLDGAGYFRSFPNARLWDGFFAAVLIRAGSVIP